MGNIFDSLFNPVNKYPGSQKVVTVPVQKVPTREGASGLHYSGRVYANEYNSLSTDICKGQTVAPDKVNEVMPNSISTVSIQFNPTTKRLDTNQLANYVKGLVAKGVIPGNTLEFDALMQADTAFYNAIQTEYCFYETRYKAALTEFITQVSTQNGTDTTSALNATINLNIRLNTLLEILNHVSNLRATAVNNRSPQITDANKKLQEAIKRLQEQKAMLETSDGRIRTQEEMIRYSAEKSRAMNIQIMFFVAMNVVALGTIITVYKSMRPSA